MVKGWASFISSSSSQEIGTATGAFSRDRADKRYVQDLLREQHERLHAWLAEGAAIYVCGSLQGMACGVDAALRELLGDQAVDDLIEEGRYRRDVY